ncbi:protein shisa-9B isoform X2 [Nothobranchius furzeri]|uniref:protein shisa-9B isoform X2 n=1 Tax=Nothobranchius furzeri TaxID=105023 RepID=UPI0039046B53
MRGTELLLGYFLVKVLVCDAEGELDQSADDFIIVTGFNESVDGESAATENPHTEDKCSGYYDVMGQWDPPFVCRTGSYLYCCGTCGFRFCCEYKSSRLDQTTCKNYDTPPWMMTGRPPPKVDVTSESAKDKTNLIVYVICGVVAIMALIGIFTKLGLEKTHRPNRDNMSRALAHVIRHPASEHTDDLGLNQHYENIHTRLMLDSFPEKVNDQSNRRQVMEMTTKGGLPMEGVDTEPEPRNPYSPPRQRSSKQKGHNYRSHRSNSSQSLYYSSNTITSPGGLRSWQSKDTLGHQQCHGQKKHSVMENELHNTLYMPPQPYFVTNSKTEVTV